MERWRGGVDQKLDSIVEDLRGIAAQLAQREAHHEQRASDVWARIGAIERYQSEMKGKIAMLAVAASLLGSIIVSFAKAALVHL